MKKYNLSAEETEKFLYRGKIHRIKAEDIYNIIKNPTDLEIKYFKDVFLSKNNYKISYEDIENCEKRVGVKLPADLKNFYHECGDLDINHCFSIIFDLTEIEFSHTWLKEDLEDNGYSQNKKEKILKETENILMFWRENQGVWNAGIKKEDLVLENPPVYISTNDDLYSWAKTADNIDTFIIGQIIDNLSDSDFYFERFDERNIKDIYKFLKKEKIFLEELKKTTFQISERKIKFSSYTDYDEDFICFFIFKGDEISKAFLIKPKIMKDSIKILEKNIDEIEKIISYGKNSLCFLDWKCELSDFIKVFEIMGKSKEEISKILKTENFDEDDDITVWCEEFDKIFKKENIMLGGFDTGSDTYCIFPISFENFEILKKSAKRLGLRTDCAVNL